LQNNLPSAILVYALIPADIVIFVRPLLQTIGNSARAAGIGALFGFVVYGCTIRRIEPYWKATRKNYLLSIFVGNVFGARTARRDAVDYINCDPMGGSRMSFASMLMRELVCPRW